VGIKIGIWLGLIAAAAIAYRGYLGMQDEGTSLADVREQASGALSGFTAGAGGEGSSGSTATATATAPASATTEPPAPPIPPSAAPPLPDPPDATPA
jgi:hypothetical protein